MLLRIAYLARRHRHPIREGGQPAQLNRQRLARATSLPIDWQQQREMLGFACLTHNSLQHAAHRSSRPPKYPADKHATGPHIAPSESSPRAAPDPLTPEGRAELRRSGAL